VEISLFPLDETFISSAVNNPFRNYRLRDSLRNEVDMKKVGWSSLLVATLVLVFGIAAEAQQPAKVPRVGLLRGRASASGTSLDGVVGELRALGYVDGKNITFESRSAENKLDRLPALAEELVGLKVDLLLVPATVEALVAKNATRTIPIVCLNIGDPVALGLVNSFARPGGNITGVRTGSELASGKRVERLKQAVPSLSSVAVVWNAKQPAMSRTLVQPTVNAARTLRMQPRVLGVENEAQLNAALDVIAREGLESLVLGPALSVAPGKFNLVPDFAAQLKIPQIYADEDMVRKGGGLMCFNSNRAAQYQRAAEFVDKIWRGTRPADIPVEEPIEIDFIVNLPFVCAVPCLAVYRGTRL